MVLTESSRGDTLVPWGRYRVARVWNASGSWPDFAT